MVTATNNGKLFCFHPSGRMKQDRVDGVNELRFACPPTAHMHHAPPQDEAARRFMGIAPIWAQYRIVEYKLILLRKHRADREPAVAVVDGHVLEVRIEVQVVRVAAIRRG